jgi:Flp pilus assembly protein CpaB
MEMKYVPPPRRKARLIILVGVVLAIGAGGSAFMLVNQAQSDSNRANTPRVSVVVAARAIPARKTVDAGDLVVRELPADALPRDATMSDPALAIGRIAAVTILAGQPLTPNLFATSTGTGVISVLAPDETVTANSPVWRAVAISVPDDRALGGMLVAGQTVDVFVTVPVMVPADATTETGTSSSASSEPKYYTDRSTKIMYQGVPIIAKSATYYIVRVTQQVAEEIAHLEASGAAAFSFALRPDIDNRVNDVSKLGETTNLIIQRYSVPVPEEYPTDGSKVNNPVPGKPAPLPYITASSPAP